MITAVATDATGNTRSASASVILDTIPPKITLASIPSQTNNPQLTITGTVEDSSLLFAKEGGVGVTVNGKPATLFDNSFTAPVNLTEGANTINVIAKDLAGNSSTITVTIIYAIPPTDPVLSIQYPRNGQVFDYPWINSRIMGSINDSAATVTVNNGRCFVNGNTYLCGYYVPFVDGANTITVTAIDASGGSTSASVTVYYDDTLPPTISLDSIPSSTSSSIIDIKAYITEYTGIQEIKINDIAAAVSKIYDYGYYQASVPNVQLAEGANTITITATDTLGNTSNATATVTYTPPDTTPPVITITTPSDGSYTNNSDVTIAGNVNEFSYIKINGLDYGIALSNFSHTVSVAEGENIITVSATDEAGNTSTAAVRVICDTIAPVIAITTPTSGYLTTNTVSIIGTIDDSKASIKGQYYDYDQGKWIEQWTGTVTGNTFEINNVQLKEGSNTIIIKAVDPAGNTSSYHYLYLTVDTIIPVVTITTPIDGSYVKDTTATVCGSVNEYSFIKINGQDYGNTSSTFSKTVSLAEGENNIVVTAADPAGNTANASVKVIKDAIAPLISITAPAYGSYIDTSTFIVSGTIDDETAAVAVNGMTAVVSDSTFTAENVTFNGSSNTITAVAKDLAGNTATASIIVIRDTTPPVIVISNPASGSAYKTASVTVAGLIDDNKATVSVNGVYAIVGGNTFSASGIPLTNEEANAITVTATDPSGNTSIATVTVYLDTTPPQIASTTPADGAVSVQTQTEIVVKFNEPVDPTTISSSIFTLYSEAGAIPATATYDEVIYTAAFKPIFELAPNTTYTATLKSGIKDTLGNATTADYSWSFKTGISSIKITITEPQDGATINKTQTLVKGTFESVTTDTGIRVNGVIAEINGSNWAAVVPLITGANTIIAEAVNTEGGTGKASINVNTQSTNPPLKITVTPTSGIAPFSAIVAIDTSIINAIASYKIDFEGNGVTDLETTSTDGITHIYDMPGIYFPTVTVTDSHGSTYMETTMVNALDKEQMDTLLKGKWEGMKGAMVSGDINTAMNYFIEGQDSKYKAAFVELKDQLPVIFAVEDELQYVSLSNNRAEYDDIVLGTDASYSYPIIFIKDENGLWKIKQF